MAASQTQQQQVSSNPLMSRTRPSDASPEVQLHPLVLLTISDYIARHDLRQQRGPIVGAILGQQNGRELTMEVAFECKVTAREDAEHGSEEVVMDWEWFGQRLESFKEVYKAEKLDLVGWFTVGETTGPQPHFLPIHRQLQLEYNESAILLLFHPSLAADESTLATGKMPISLYESVWEGSAPGVAGDAFGEDGTNNIDGDHDKAMEIDSGAGARQLKFREMEFAIETSEAEMISVHFVARGAGNAGAVEAVTMELQETDLMPGVSKGPLKSPTQSKKRKGKRKQKAGGPAETGSDTGAAILSPEDEELLQTLANKYNAIKMLQSRIGLLSAYLASIPPSHLTDASIPISSNTALSSSGQQQQQPTELNHSILRSISALVSRLPLLTPPQSSTSPSSTHQTLGSGVNNNTLPTPSSAAAAAPSSTLSTSPTFEAETLTQSSDVALVNLLASITESVHTARELGLKHAVFESGRKANARAAASAASSAGGLGRNRPRRQQHLLSSGGDIGGPSGLPGVSGSGGRGGRGGGGGGRGIPADRGRGRGRGPSQGRGGRSGPGERGGRGDGSRGPGRGSRGGRDGRGGGRVRRSSRGRRGGQKDGRADGGSGRGVETTTTTGKVTGSALGMGLEGLRGQKRGSGGVS